VVSIGSATFPPHEYRAAIEQLGVLEGRAALKHTFAIGIRSTRTILDEGPEAVRRAGVTALIVDQASPAWGTVADLLGLPFVTGCNALVLHGEPDVPPFFTAWQPRNQAWSRFRNRLAWAALNRLYAPILAVIRDRRVRAGLSIPSHIEQTWSTRLQVSQQPAPLEFPRRRLPAHFRFVGPLRLPGGYPPVDFPWEQLDGRPIIYVTLGTLQNRIAGTFRSIAEACDGLGAQLVISTGHGVPPESLSDLPGNPVVVSYAPQLELLERAMLAITHAGLNTVLDALSTGVPMVAIPVTNEQPGIAARMAATGAGEMIPLKKATTDRIRTLVAKVMSEPAYRTASIRVRDSIRDAGGAPRAAELIEAAVAARQP
jgi:MGT family glycosyltransferase